MKYYTIVVSDLDPLVIKQDLMKYNNEIAILDADRIICKEQIYAAILRANRARKRENMIARTWGIELILQLSGTHQIKKAFKIIDITKFTKRIIVIGKNLKLENLKLENLKLEILVGLPEFKVTDELIQLYQLSSHDHCKEVIAMGVLFTTDHE